MCEAVCAIFQVWIDWVGLIADPPLIVRKRTPQALGHTLYQGHLQLLLLVAWVGGSHSWVVTPPWPASWSIRRGHPARDPAALISNPILSHNHSYQLLMMILMRMMVMRMVALMMMVMKMSMVDVLMMMIIHLHLSISLQTNHEI